MVDGVRTSFFQMHFFARLEIFFTLSLFHLRLLLDVNYFTLGLDTYRRLHDGLAVVFSVAGLRGIEATT